MVVEATRPARPSLPSHKDRLDFENPKSIPMKLNLAELHALRQDFNVSENLYRDVLKVEPKNIVASSHRTVPL